MAESEATPVGPDRTGLSVAYLSDGTGLDGWYWWETEYPEKGSCGPFKTRLDAMTNMLASAPGELQIELWGAGHLRPYGAEQMVRASRKSDATPGTLKQGVVRRAEALVGGLERMTSEAALRRELDDSRARERTMSDALTRAQAAGTALAKELRDWKWTAREAERWIGYALGALTQARTTIGCMFCGHVERRAKIDEVRPAIVAHMLVCERHPMRLFEDQARAQREELSRLRAHIRRLELMADAARVLSESDSYLDDCKCRACEAHRVLSRAFADGERGPEPRCRCGDGRRAGRYFYLDGEEMARALVAGERCEKCRHRERPYGEQYWCGRHLALVSPMAWCPWWDAVDAQGDEG